MRSQKKIIYFLFFLGISCVFFFFSNEDKIKQIIISPLLKINGYGSKGIRYEIEIEESCGRASQSTRQNYTVFFFFFCIIPVFHLIIFWDHYFCNLTISVDPSLHNVKCRDGSTLDNKRCTQVFYMKLFH